MPPFASLVSMATGLNLATHCMVGSSAEPRMMKDATRTARKRTANEIIVSARSMFDDDG